MQIDKADRVSIAVAAVLGGLLVVSALFFIRFDLTVRAAGVVIPNVERRFYADDDVVVKRIHVGLGQSVDKGEPLLELENLALCNRLFELESDLEETTASLADKEFELGVWDIRPGSLEFLTAESRHEICGRIRKFQEDTAKIYSAMRDRLTISQIELNQRQIERARVEMEWLSSAEMLRWQTAGISGIEKQRLVKGVQSLEARKILINSELIELRQRIESLRITAPIPGEVGSLPPRHEGESFKRGDLLVTVVDPAGGYRVRAKTPHRNIDLVRPGTRTVMAAEVFNSLIEGYVHGEVLRVAPEADPVSSLKEEPLYEVEIAVLKTPHPLVLGSPMIVWIIVGKKSLPEMLIRSDGFGHRGGLEKNQR